MKQQPWTETLHIIQLLIEGMEGDIPAEIASYLFQVNPKKVMERATGTDREEIGIKLEPEELANSTPYQAERQAY